MSGSYCCFLTYIQVSQEAGKFGVIDTVKGFSIVSEAEVDVLLELFGFFYVDWMLAI